MEQLNTYDINDLIYLMSRLRDPKTGCPWDCKQTYETIVPYTLEEAYEVADAIENKNVTHLKEELGDLLFQVIFYSQLSKEDNYFEFSDVVHHLVSKLVRRHPHVFPDGTLNSNNLDQPLSEALINKRWEAIKQEEREHKSKKEDASKAVSVLDDIPSALPALTRAEKLQKRAASVGFDWPDIEPVLEKLQEEIVELREAISSGQSSHIQDEMGDLLFVCVNLARHVGVKADSALRSTNKKFERRFKYIESKLLLQGKDLQDVDLDTMELLWQEAKQLEAE